MNRRDRQKLGIFLGMVAPGLIIYLFIVAYPIFYSVGLSFSDFNPNSGGVWNFIGLTHYQTMIEDPYFWHSLKNNMIVVGVSVFGQIPLGLLLAYILFRKMVKGVNFFQSMVFLPQFLSTIVIGLLWRRMFSADGPVATLMQWFTGDPRAQFDLMLQADTVMYPIGFALIWMYTGFYMVIFLANMQKIDGEMLEAAMIDGANEVQVFFRLMVPILGGTILVSTILAIAGSLKGFDLIFAITTQGLQRNNAMVLPIYMYQTAFQDFTNPLRFAYGSAISNAIVVVSFILIGISNWVGKKLSPEEV